MAAVIPKPPLSPGAFVEAMTPLYPRGALTAIVMMQPIEGRLDYLRSLSVIPRKVDLTDGFRITRRESPLERLIEYAKISVRIAVNVDGDDELTVVNAATQFTETRDLAINLFQNLEANRDMSYKEKLKFLVDFRKSVEDDLEYEKTTMLKSTYFPLVEGQFDMGPYLEAREHLVHSLLVEALQDEELLSNSAPLNEETITIFHQLSEFVEHRIAKAAAFDALRPYLGDGMPHALMVNNLLMKAFFNPDISNSEKFDFFDLALYRLSLGTEPRDYLALFEDTCRILEIDPATVEDIQAKIYR